MREILFRGKRVIDGEWAESCYPLGEMHSGTVTYDFDKKTVCQYIGLTDKNGRKIFEGDIVKDENIHLLGVVKFSERYLQFVVDDIHDGEQDYSEFMNQVEVIGNVYEDADLME